MVAGVAPPLFPHQSPGLGHRYQSFHHHTRSRNNTRSKHIRMPPHHTGALMTPMAPPGSAGMSGREPGGSGGRRVEAPSPPVLLLFCWWFLQSLLEVAEDLW